MLINDKNYEGSIAFVDSYGLDMTLVLDEPSGLSVGDEVTIEDGLTEYYNRYIIEIDGNTVHCGDKDTAMAAELEDMRSTLKALGVTPDA